MNAQPPLVTILVACYQQAHLISATLDSILAQTYENLEIVVSDDASTDGTAEIVQAYVDRFPGKLKLLRSECNLGITGNCRRLAEHIGGHYVCWFSGDDLMHPEKITRQVAALEALPTAVFCYHDCDVFNGGSGETIYRYNGPGGHHPYSGDVTRQLLIHRCFICAISVLHRTSGISKQGYDVRIPNGSDWLFFIETSMNGHVVYLPDVLARYRRHPGNITARKPSCAEESEIYRIVAGRYPRFSGVIDKGLARMYLVYVAKFLISGAPREAFVAGLGLCGVLLRRPAVIGSVFAGLFSLTIRQIFLRRSRSIARPRF